MHIVEVKKYKSTSIIKRGESAFIAIITSLNEVSCSKLAYGTHNVEQNRVKFSDLIVKAQNKNSQ